MKAQLPPQYIFGLFSTVMSTVTWDVVRPTLPSSIISSKWKWKWFCRAASDSVDLLLLSEWVCHNFFPVSQLISPRCNFPDSISPLLHPCYHLDLARPVVLMRPRKSLQAVQQQNIYLQHGRCVTSRERGIFTMCIISKHTMCYWSSTNRALGPVKEHHLNCPEVELCFQDWNAEYGHVQGWANICRVYFGLQAKLRITQQSSHELIPRRSEHHLSSAKPFYANPNCSALCQTMTPELDTTRCLFFFPASTFSDLASSGLISWLLILPFAFFWKIELMR